MEFAYGKLRMRWEFRTLSFPVNSEEKFPRRKRRKYINEQTIYRRKRDAEFMRKYSEARRERTEAARNVLQERAHAAADTLATIMQDKDAPAQTRVSAAAEILRQTVKYTEITDMSMMNSTTA